MAQTNDDSMDDINDVMSDPVSPQASQQSGQSQPPHFDPSGFVTDPYIKRVEKPWGYELHWVPEGLPYMGKIEHIKAGECQSLQMHDRKQESYFLLSGRAALEWENSRGEMVKVELRLGYGYRTSAGQKHRLIGITDCDIVEVSTSEGGTTWRLDDKYGRPHETDAQRKLERGEAA